MKKHSNIVAAILAGGKSSRFGNENKALAKINEITLIEHVYLKLQPLFDEIIIVGNGYEHIPTLKNAKHISDEYQNIGPLGGIHVALKNCSSDALFVVSCDMPFLNPELILSLQNFFLKSDADILVPTIDNKIEPLHGFYKKQIFEMLDNYLKKATSFKILKFFDTVKTIYHRLSDLPEIRTSFSNINTQDDFKKMIDNGENSYFSS